MDMPFEKLINAADKYQSACAENYDRVRDLANNLQSGFQDWLAAKDGISVHLVPPTGPFKPMPHGDKAFSQPARGFRQLEPIAFGLAVRVSRGTDWVRLTLICGKSGDRLSVNIVNGKTYRFSLPLTEDSFRPFYRHLYDHITNQFQERLDDYADGAYGSREIGFEFLTDTGLNAET